MTTVSLLHVFGVALGFVQDVRADKWRNVLPLALGRSRR
jgi:hypothetical protein